LWQLPDALRRMGREDLARLLEPTGSPRKAVNSNFALLGITPNPLFVGRKAELLALRSAMFPAGESIGELSAALTQGFTGEGGIGKSQLAQRFAELSCAALGGGKASLGTDWELFDCAWWLDCSNQGHAQAVRALAGHLGYAASPEDLPASLRAAIRSRLDDGRRHLLILDNLDAMDEPARAADGSGTQWGRAEGWVLVGGSRILMTTREQHLPRKYGRRVELGVLTVEEARALLRGDRVDLQDTTEAAANARLHQALDAVSEHLGRLALAVDLCRAWLEIHSGRTPSDLVSELKRSDAAAVAIFEADELKDQAHRYRVGVAASLALHMDALAETPAERLLHAAAFAAPDRIPVGLLTEAAGASPEDVEDALVTLAGKSLLHRQGSGRDETISLHRLTQLVVRARLGSVGIIKVWLGALIELYRWPGTPAEELLDHTRTSERRAALTHAEVVISHASGLTAAARDGAASYLRRAPTLEEAALPTTIAPRIARLRGELAHRFRSFGQLTAALGHIEAAISWGEGQNPRDERRLAIWYASRARIRQVRSDLKGAEEDIARSIQWGEEQNPHDERSLAIRYAYRASIRQDRGDLKGAEDDIAKSIQWAEQQDPHDERSLAIRYASRASIRQFRGDLQGAEDDIAISIQWGEQQIPRDERLLAIWYGVRARILKKWAIAACASGDFSRARKLFADAKADIDSALDWWLAHLPDDERAIDILREDKAKIEAAERGE
jgi:hypothetical protein